VREGEGNETKYYLAYIATEALSSRPLRWLLAVLFQPLKLYVWGYRTFFPERYAARMARADAAAVAYLEQIELNEPDLYETATGRKPRTPAEIHAGSRE
jgi:hypothetical protein